MPTQGLGDIAWGELLFLAPLNLSIPLKTKFFYLFSSR